VPAITLEKGTSCYTGQPGWQAEDPAKIKWSVHVCAKAAARGRAMWLVHSSRSATATRQLHANILIDYYNTAQVLYYVHPNTIKYDIGTMQKKSWKELGFVPDSEDEDETIEASRELPITEYRSQDLTHVNDDGEAQNQDKIAVRCLFPTRCSTANKSQGWLTSF
jgi:hypothetical protein